MAVNLTLNDFRSVLGMKNDGNVVMKQDQSGIEKANWGGIFRNLFCNVRKAPSDPAENMQIRKALLSAIMTSAEGKVLSQDQLDSIYAALGMADALDADKFSAPLTRRELKSVIDVIDGATKNDALVEKNIRTLDEKGTLDNNVAGGVKKAMKNARCLQPFATVKEGVAAARTLFGADFKGRTPAEMEKFVRQNMAVIREQVFDKLYWTNPSIKDFTDEIDFNQAQDMEADEELFVKVDQQTVTNAFREVVGSLMEKFAAGERVTTRIETLAHYPEEVNFADDQEKNVWKSVINGYKLENLVTNVFETTKGISGSFATLQMRNAAQSVKNMLRSTFSQLFVENKSNSQATEKAFNEKMSSFETVLKELAADMNALGPEASGKILSDVADKLGRLVVDKDIASHKGMLADATIKAFDDVVKSFSSRHIVEDFVNEQFAYLEDRKPVVDFFMSKIANVGGENGITTNQRTTLTNFQAAAASGKATDVVRQDLKLLVLTPLATAYNEMLVASDPEKVREQRQTRNEKAFASLVKTTEGYDSKTEADKAEALLKLKLETLLAKVGRQKVFDLGIIESTGAESVKKGDNRLPSEDALACLEEQLLAMDDKEFEFFSQYCAKGMRKADSDIDTFLEAFLNDKKPPVFENALKDGTISISSIPAKSVKMLHKLIEAQINANVAMNGGEPDHVSLRSLLSPSEETSPVSTALFKRLTDRIASSGVKPLPDCCKAPGPNASEGDIARSLNNAAKFGFGKIPGFGTMDLGRILKLMGDMGIDMSAIGGNDINAKVDVYEKVLCLSTLAAMSGFKLDGLAEFTERVMGKKFEDVNYTDILKMLQKEKLVQNGVVKSNLTVADPIAKLSGAQKTAKELFAGELALAGAEFTSDDTAALLLVARNLAHAAPGEVKSSSVTVKGVNIDLTRLAGGELSVKVGGMPMRAAFDAHGLVRMLENEITSNPASFSPEIVKSTLPTMDAVKKGEVPLVRARELYAKTAAAKTGLLPVMFSSYTTDQLRDIAIRSVDGTFTAENLPKNPPANYNSGAMLEMHANLSLTSSTEIDAKVKIATPETKSIELRRTVAPDPQTVRNLVADLFLNKDTWEFDAGKAPGERIRKLLVENEPELSFILKQLDDGHGFLSPMPPEVRDAAKSVFEEIRKLDIAKLKNPAELDGAVRNALAAIETKVNALADSLVNTMQDKVTALFAPKAQAQDAKPDWQKTFAELTGKEGIDENTKQGKFTMTVLRNYFKNSAAVDKRAMLSAFIRNTDDASSDAKQVAELLKGAGPLLQKMLQGLPLSSFNAETQIALKDMKSRLLPIPDEAVKAQMLELVNSSNGNILSIEVKKSLGAATVGQAFLCNIKTKDHPFAGVDCVVKLLRPNVDTAIQREKAMIDKIIADDPAMKATFDGQYRKILEEFDLTLESTNVGIGTKIYEMPKGARTLHSMEMLEGTTATMTSMIVKKADGATFDSTIETIRREADEVLAPFKQTTEVDGVKKTVYKAANTQDMALARRTLLAKAAKLNDRRNHVLDVTKAWFDNALFGNGFFHGDLHGGNLMTGVGGTTFIDFGNCSRLNKTEQGAIRMMLAAIVSGDADHVAMNFKKLLPQEAQAAFDAKFPANSQAMKDLVGVLRRGNAYDLMSRLQAFVSTVQGADVQIPPALQNFVQSYMRLADIVADIDRTVQDLQIAASSIYFDSPALAPVEGEPKVFAHYKAIARAYVGDANTPYSEAAVTQAIKDAKAYLKSDEGKAEVRSLMRDEQGNLSLQKYQDKVVPFAKSMEFAAQSCAKKFLVPTMNEVGRFGQIGWLIHPFEAIERIQTGNDKAGKTIDDHLADAEERLSSLFDGAENYFVQQMSLVYDGESTFNEVAMKVDKSMTNICTDVISDHQTELGVAALVEYGVTGVWGFKNRLGDEFTAADAVETRRKNLGPAISGLNDALPVGERLSGKDLATLLRATDTYFTPSPRPDEKDGWCANAENRAKVLDSLAYSLKRGADALGTEHLTPAAARFATLNFGLAGGKIATSIFSLSDAEYNTLLAEAQQRDDENGGHELATALETLRTSQEMFNTVNEE